MNHEESSYYGNISRGQCDDVVIAWAAFLSTWMLPNGFSNCQCDGQCQNRKVISENNIMIGIRLSIFVPYLFTLSLSSLSQEILQSISETVPSPKPRSSDSSVEATATTLLLSTLCPVWTLAEKTTLKL